MPGGQLDRPARAQRDVLDRHALLRVSAHAPAAALPLEVLGRGLEHRAGYDPRALAHLARGQRGGGAATGVERDPYVPSP